MTDFIEGGPFRPPICEQPQKSSSWIGLITWKVAQSKRKTNNNKSWARNNFQKTSSKFSNRILLPHEWDLFIQSLQCERPVFPDIALRETSLSSHCTVTDLFIQSLHCERPVYPVIALWQTCLSSHCTVRDLFIQSLHCERPVYLKTHWQIPQIPKKWYFENYCSCDQACQFLASWGTTWRSYLKNLTIDYKFINKRVRLCIDQTMFREEKNIVRHNKVAK